MPVHPYPQDRWPKLTAAHARAQNAWLRSLARIEDSAAIGCAQQLLGGSPSVEWGAAQLSDKQSLHTRLQEPLLAVLLERGAGGVDERCAIECAPHTAAWLVDLTLGGDGALAESFANQALDELSQGALAYLVARVLAAADGGFGLRALLSDRAALSDALASPLLLVPATLRIGARSGTLRVLLPLSAAVAAGRHVPHASPTGDAAPAWLDAVPISLWADAGRAVLDHASLQSLGRGDVVVLDDCSLAPHGAGFAGNVSLRMDGSQLALRCDAAAATLELRAIETRQDAPMTSGRRHDTGQAPDTTRALLDAAPIELQLEIARFSLPLGELAQLAPGQVFSTGRRIGESVTLRAAGRAIAEGELVDVDGEVGVRILQLMAAPETTR